MTRSTPVCPVWRPAAVGARLMPFDENVVKRFFLFLSVAFVSTAFSACTAEGIYEGSRAYNKAIKSTPMEKSKEELPSYDQYEKERRGAAKERSE